MPRTSPSYIGSYRLLNIVHTGQNCHIWQAYDDVEQRIVGIKTLFLELDVTVPVGQFKIRTEAFLEMLAEDDLF